LRELRITSVLRNAAIQGRNVGRIKCNGPVNFFQCVCDIFCVV
jgi:hypothetical protein